MGSEAIRRSSPMRSTYRLLFSGLTQKTVGSALAFRSVVRNLIMDVRDCYRPGLHDMRGPEPVMARQALRERRGCGPTSDY
jgi:hypothetical protein